MTRIHSADFWAQPERATLERHLVDRCREIAVAMAAYMEVISQRKGGRGSGTTAGAPDALLYCNAHVIPIEFKRFADGRISQVQAATIARRKAQGVETAVVRDEGEFVRLVNSCRSVNGERKWPFR
jgi:hypothetical protein